MELLNLPQKAYKAKPYKYFKMDSRIAMPLTVGSKKEFFFIGSAPHKITFLLEMFDGGYTAETPANAVSILKRNMVKGIFPEIIILDGALGEAGIVKLLKELRDIIMHESIPVVLDVSSFTPAMVQRYRKIKMLDDMVVLDTITASKMRHMIDFLKKIKRTPVALNEATEVEKLAYTESTLSYVCKRTFDILLSSLAIIALSPLFLLIAILIKAESGGPIFFVAKRAGRGYKIFNFYKFRTMVVDAEKKLAQMTHLNQYQDNDGAGPVFFKVSNDPRITRIGAYLRNSSLDELPQLFNVFLGDMSIVGNRPLPLYEAETLTTDDCAARFMAPAGITGLWQIKKRGSGGNMSARERIDLDIDYAEKYNFVYDLWIIANTPSALLQKENV